jgi:hypothetical protein
MPGQLAHWLHICGLFSVGKECEVLGDLPYEDLAIVGAGSDDTVVEGVPVRVQHHSCVSAEQRYYVGDLSPLVQWDDSECATATRLPIDREVFWVDLYYRDMLALAFDIAAQQKMGQEGARAATRLVSQAFLLIWRLS